MRSARSARPGGAARLGRAVNQDVDAAQLGRRGLDHGAHRAVIGRVGHHGEHPVPVPGDLHGCGFQGVLVAGHQDHVGTLRGQGVGDGPADPPARPGDDGPLPA